MKISVSSLENRPAELRMLLSETYVNHWWCDKRTIQQALNEVTQLGFTAQTELETANRHREAENNTPETRKNVHEEEQRLDNAAIEEREILRQQREAVKREEKHTSFFSVAKLRSEAERLRRMERQSVNREERKL